METCLTSHAGCVPMRTSRWLKLALLSLVSLSTTAVACNSSRGTVPDSQAIQGEWIAVQAEENGKTYEPDGITWVMGDGKVSLISGGQTTQSGIFTLKPSSNPAAIDFQMKGEMPGIPDEVAIGIYKLEKDKLTLCLGGKDGKGKRPTTFKYDPNTATLTLILERVK